MGKDVFSVPIFFIMFRETLEASIIVSVLLGMCEQLVRSGQITGHESTGHVDIHDASAEQKRLLKKLRIQIWAGAGVGLFIALAIGAAFIAVYFTELKDLWASSEELWEGIFSLIAAIMIFIMAIAMLKMDRAKAKWRYKLQLAFQKRHEKGESGGRASKYALFLLPLVTVLREGLEAVVFIGGVSLGQSATSIPLAAIVGLICGFLVGLVIYFSSRKIDISIFLIISTSFLLLIGAGLFTRTVQYFNAYHFNNLTGGDAGESGSGPGSYDVRSVVWHLDCCSPENKFDGYGWSIFNALFGWNNTATIGSILAYISYWVAVLLALFFLKWKEGRVTYFGKESRTGRERRARRAAKSLDNKAPFDSPQDVDKSSATSH